RRSRMSVTSRVSITKRSWSSGRRSWLTCANTAFPFRAGARVSLSPRRRGGYRPRRKERPMSSEHVTAFRPMLMHKGFAQNFLRAHRLLENPSAHGMYAFTGERSEEYRPYGYRDGIAVIAV